MLNKPITGDFLSGYKTSISAILMMIAIISRIEIDKVTLSWLLDILIANLDITITAIWVIYWTVYKILRLYSNHTKQSWT